MFALDKFVTLVDRSELIDADRLVQVVADWKRLATARELGDSRHFAEHLVATGLITDWQRKKLLEGRYRGFLLGKYKLLDHLGSGGMSSVYLAEHVLMQRRVAIKVLPHNRVGDSSYLARFYFEAQAAAALDHRNIVRVYDLDNEEKIHYLVMEYIEGRDLEAVVSEDGPLGFHAAANVVAQAATGLDHAHHRSLVHRDIKPANLLVDLMGTVKILDMGLAKFVSEARPNPRFSQEEQVLGTADYLAPEQAINSQTVDHRADIYALGCTLYFLLTGHPPFADGTSLERMTAHQHQSPPSLLVERPNTPPRLAAICQQMMEKAPDDRFQSASEVAQALGDWLDEERAAGRTDTVGLAIAARGSSARARQQTESKTNLVSGSKSDLYLMPPEAPQPSLSSQTPDSNSNHGTTEVPLERPIEPSRTTGASTPESPESHVLSTGNVAVGESPSGGAHAHLGPPPIAAPPRDASSATPLARLPTPVAVSPWEAPSIRTSASMRTAFKRARGRARHDGPRVWLWAIVLSGLILCAAGALVIALSR